jgi:hypothetical protein
MRRIIETLLILLLVPGFGWAKSAQNNWDDLKQLTPGQKVEVVDSKVKTLKGAFVSFTDEAISLQVGKSEESVARAIFVRVSVRDTSHRARNMVLASGVIGGIMLIPAVLVIGESSNEGGCGSRCHAAEAAIAAGFGGGLALGAIPGSRTIYRIKK